MPKLYLIAIVVWTERTYRRRRRQQRFERLTLIEFATIMTPCSYRNSSFHAVSFAAKVCEARRLLVLYGVSPYHNPMATTSSRARSARLDLRMTVENREVLNQAAALNGTSLSDYVMSVLIPAARRDLLQHRMLQLAPEAWDDFMTALSEPDNEAAAALRTQVTRWDAPAE